MKAYAPDAIIIADNRQRQEFDAQGLEDLRESIEGKQLMHAPVVRELDGKPTLVAGERRLRVIKDIFALGGWFEYDGERYDAERGVVPTVSLGELTFIEAEEAELDENLKRKDLTWQEHADAVRRLHELRQGQKETAYDAAEADGGMEAVAAISPHTVADTARELLGRGDGRYAAETRKEIIVAKHLSNPEVAKAKTLDDAYKILQRSEKSAENIALAAKVGATFTADLHRAYHDNCLDWMADQLTVAPDYRCLYDVILTDPPYGMGAGNFGDGGGKLAGIEHHYDDSPEAWLTLMQEWAKLSFQIAKPQAHAYVFCDIDRFHRLKDLMEAAGWYVFRTPLIDYKLGSGRVPLPDRGPRRCWEMILYAIKGNKPVTHIYPDVIECRADENMTHGAQKPVALYQNLLMRSVRPGDKVLDTFSGSGTIFDACHAMQCEATGIEQEAEYYAMGLKRLNALKAAADPLLELTA